MGLDGIVDVHITDRNVNGEVFCEFTEKTLLPQLLPFNGINGRNIVVMARAKGGKGMYVHVTAIIIVLCTVLCRSVV